MKGKATILLNNQKSRVLTTRVIRMRLRDIMKIKAKNYFWSPAYRRGAWDGYVNYISEENGVFSTGLLDQVIKHLRNFKVKITIEDDREVFKGIHIPKNLGGLKAYDYQEKARVLTLNHKIEGVRFQRGILDEATNAGKSLIAALVMASFSKKRRGLFLVNGKSLYEQALKDFEKLLPGEIGQVNAKKTIWKRINVCMVQTLGRRIKSNPHLRAELQKMDMVIVDEVDEVISRKDCQMILGQAFNATIRLGLSGTALLSKDKVRNQNVLAYFGPVIHTISNKELVDKGISTPPKIRFFLGNHKIRRDGDYQYELEYGIIKNVDRHRRIWERVRKHIEKGRVPIVILFRFHKHAMRIMRRIPEDIELANRVEVVHHETFNRVEILEDFNKGKIQVLLASMIIKRGLNLPKMKVLINAAGGDSHVTILQVLGRTLRKHKSKKIVYIDEFWDMGMYLRRHSGHRITYYKNQKFGVSELYKKQLKKVLL